MRLVAGNAGTADGGGVFQFNGRGLSGVKRTLRRGRRINASFTFTATDAAGNKATAKRRVKLAAR